MPAEFAPPDLATVRAEMAIPSRDFALRGQRDATGFASTAAQMDRAWDASALPPAPAALGPAPPRDALVSGIVCPHDDYVYAGRTYRSVIPLVRAPVVIVLGVFHRYRRFDLRGRLVFDPYEAWSAPGGPVPVDDLREDLVARLPADAYVRNAAMHDAEHSIEALVYWLQRAQPGVRIVPVLAPAAPWDRMVELAEQFRAALDGALAARGWVLGRDVALAISADAIHYGEDFAQTRFGPGGAAAYEQAVALDRALLTGPLQGRVTLYKTYTLYETYVDPRNPDAYRWTWCGRFSVPFGLLVLAPDAIAWPIAYETSLSAPELPLREVGLGVTAPATLEHFVGYPAVAFTQAPPEADAAGDDAREG
jgi:AmmeMemoRadiSam system protein B